MDRKLLADHKRVGILLDRLCRQLWERSAELEQLCIVGMQPRGVLLAAAIHARLQALSGRLIPHGQLDITFYRDDFRRRDEPLRANQTNIPFLIEGQNVVLVDDVLFTGRSVRAGLDALNAFGRPRKVELLVLVDRKFTREIPLEATYIGLQVDSISSQKVLVEWKQSGQEEDAVWLLS